MNILKKLNEFTTTYFAKTSEDFRKPSNQVSETIPNDSEENFTKDLPNLLPNLQPNSPSNQPPQDGRKKPRTQKQIEAYKKNFSNRHKPKIPKKNPPNVYDKIFSS
jgi:hypothetical protein